MRNFTLQFDNETQHYVVCIDGEATQVKITEEAIKMKKKSLSIRKKLVSWCIEELGRTLESPLTEEEEKHIRKTMKKLVFA